MGKQLNVLLASPRGFCAGVERAIEIVERALALYGPPIYVRHEIVHNRYVVENLEAKGAVFVDELDEVPDTAPPETPVIFSAHGVPKSVPREAAERNMFFLDATCPLVSKVHREAELHHSLGHDIVLIGHAGHPEVIGTMGQLPDGAISLVETVDDVAKLSPRNPDNLAYVTQTTLAVDDTAEIIGALQKRFPSLIAPKKEDICYATTNRQDAVKEMTTQVEAVLIIGAPNSSNSKRLVEVALRRGVQASLIQRAADINWQDFETVKHVGISAGASAPEELVEEVIAAFRQRFDVTLTSLRTTEENIKFKLPAALTA